MLQQRSVLDFAGFRIDTNVLTGNAAAGVTDPGNYSNNSYNRWNLPVTLDGTNVTMVIRSHRKLLADLHRSPGELQEKVGAFGMLEVARAGRHETDFPQHRLQPGATEIVRHEVKVAGPIQIR